MSCCAVHCTNRFKRDAGIVFHTTPAKQVRREAYLRAISRVGWKAKSSDRYCGEHFVSGRLSRDPKNVDCVPTLFRGGRRRVNCSIPDQNREERSAKRAKVREEENVLMAAEGLLHMSAMTSSREDALRNASIQTDHVFPMLDPNYVVPPNQELSVKVTALQEELAELLETFTLKLSTSADGKQQPKDKILYGATYI